LEDSVKPGLAQIMARAMIEFVERTARDTCRVRRHTSNSHYYKAG